ncbi:MAG: class I mannose-6-phosphate isomerase [Planctomycetes bacterium]|nr:class I mannose-6-phosphate isomerase [Planctomycetota bacterium]
MPPLRPFLLERKLLPKVWGGRALEQVLGMSLPAGEAIGETWELFDRPEGSSRIRGSERTLADLLRDDGERVLGRGVARAHGGRFPLLLKFIDAREALSVQVHPNDEQARSEGDSGKDEAWLVLHAGPGGRIIRGVRPGIDDALFRASAHTAAVESMLWSFSPRPGDTIHVPPGTVHAIGPDVVVFEVQQNSDVTYRLYDWGRAREVHVQKALAVASTDGGRVAVADRPVVESEALTDGGRQLLSTAHFRLRRYDLQRPFTLPTDGAFLTLTVLAGRGIVGWRSGDSDTPLPVGAGDTVLVPACIESVYLSPIGRLDVAVCNPTTPAGRS